MILIKNLYAFILYVSNSCLQCKKPTIVTDMECNIGIDRLPLGRGIMTLGQSVYPDIALQIRNYYISRISFTYLSIQVQYNYTGIVF